MSSRFSVPPEMRNVGIFGGLMLMALGLLVGWVQSETQTPLPPTGGPAMPANKDAGIVKALVEWLTQKKVG